VKLKKAPERELFLYATGVAQKVKSEFDGTGSRGGITLDSPARDGNVRFGSLADYFTNIS